MGWWLTAKPGDRVVCVKTEARFASRDWLLDRGIRMPDKGKTYTLRAIGACGLSRKHYSLLLCEIVNPPLIVEDIDLGEVCWPAEWFRPAVNKATDISIFTAMLTGQPAKADA